jgi:two-component sensor histidine kinase
MTQATDVTEYTQLVRGRVGTLLRVHELLAEQGWAATDLRALVEAEVAHMAPRISFEGPVVAIVHTAAQPISMVMHELCINALKHGALTVESGRVSVSWRIADPNLLLVWQESGGPRVSAPTRRGFGTRLIEASINAQLGGTIEYHWKVGGLVCEMVIPLARAVSS